MFMWIGHKFMYSQTSNIRTCRPFTTSAHKSHVLHVGTTQCVLNNNHRICTCKQMSVALRSVQTSNSSGNLTLRRYLSLVPRLSLSLPLDFAHAIKCYAWKVEGEGEPGTEPHPPVAMVGQEYNWELPQVGTVPYQALPLLQVSTHNVQGGKV